MTEQDWLTGAYPAALLRASRGRVSHRKLRLFACACCRRHEDLINSRRMAVQRRMIEAAEAFADGQVSEDVFLAAFPDDDRERSYPSPKVLIRQAIGALSWPDREQRNWHLDERSGELVERPWEPGEYAEQFTVRVCLHTAHAAARRARADFRRLMDRESAAQTDLLRDVVGNPFRPVTFAPAWRTETAVLLARQMHESRDFANLPILADALQDAGCEAPDVLAHCRGDGPHVRGCWLIDLVLGRE
jgi:hypothetical protein